MESQEEPTIVCTNCGKDIQESKSFLHEAYCFRHIIRCSKCNEPINKSEVDIHENEVHKLVPCRYCKRDFEANIIANHVETCLQKPKMCQFCNCEVSNDEYNQHIYQCGSRTRKCSFCNKSILVRDLEAHEAACEVEQFTKGTLTTGNSEENKEDLLEDMFSRSKKREAIVDTRHIYKKKLDTYTKDLTKKRLAKLSDLKNAPPNGKTQEEIDEELARDMNKEYYEGRRTGKQNNDLKSRLRNRDQVQVEEKEREYGENRRTAKQRAGDKIKAHLRADSDDDLEKKVDEEFFKFKRSGRTKMEIEKDTPPKNIEEEDDEALARRLQQEFDRGTRPSEPQNVAQQAEYEPEYEDHSEEVYETSGPQKFEDFAYRGGRKPDASVPQFLQDEDAELQRAIQASLENQ